MTQSLVYDVFNESVYSTAPADGANISKEM